MVDDSGLYSGGGEGDPNAPHVTQEQIFPGLADLLAKIPANTLTPATIPSFFPAAAQNDNAAALTKMITDMTSTPEKLAAFTDLVAFIAKFKAA